MVKPVVGDGGGSSTRYAVTFGSRRQKPGRRTVWPCRTRCFTCRRRSTVEAAVLASRRQPLDEHRRQVCSTVASLTDRRGAAFVALDASAVSSPWVAAPPRASVGVDQPLLPDRLASLLRTRITARTSVRPSDLIISPSRFAGVAPGRRPSPSSPSAAACAPVGGLHRQDRCAPAASAPRARLPPWRFAALAARSCPPTCSASASRSAPHGPCSPNGLRAGFQPIVALDTGVTMGYEALTRR